MTCVMVLRARARRAAIRVGATAAPSPTSAIAWGSAGPVAAAAARGSSGPIGILRPAVGRWRALGMAQAR
jgi:hypothetical protein